MKCLSSVGKPVVATIFALAVWGCDGADSNEGGSTINWSQMVGRWEEPCHPEARTSAFLEIKADRTFVYHMQEFSDNMCLTVASYQKAEGKIADFFPYENGNYAAVRVELFRNELTLLPVFAANDRCGITDWTFGEKRNILETEACHDQFLVGTRKLTCLVYSHGYGADGTELTSLIPKSVVDGKQQVGMSLSKAKS